ncbi:MAG: hypothetical protein GWO11_05555 [Desulfuromonadales bacterium]|nr:hypothetical protein [Desulfuromonadales bacterium]NIR33856.1 hypothetical protein [Desulfuromonadales bacterium]NIS40007.1 hypothetical protein [Desulfuromonadales bacterium]
MGVKLLVTLVGGMTLAVLLTSSVCRAERPQSSRQNAGGWQTDVALAPVVQNDSALDRGGDIAIRGAELQIGFEKRWGRFISGGLTLNYRHTRFDFEQAAAFQESAPWDNIHAAGLAARLEWRPDRSWSLMVRPSLEFAREQGASWDDADVAGVAVTLSKRFGRRLSLGVGAAASRGLEEDEVYPMVIVFWRIGERWRLANPFRPGPTSPAGLELSYRINDDLEGGFGTTYSSERFRLDDQGPAPDGIGEMTALLSYLRLSRTMTDSFDLDLYAGIHWNGEVTLEDENGRELTDVGYDPGAVIALSLTNRF